MTNKAIKNFKPSTGDEPWLAKTNVVDQWSLVTKAWSKSRLAAEEAVRIFMEMGDLLLVLREQYKGDNEFGKARKKYAPDLSRSDAHRAMGMARNKERFTLPEGKTTPSLSVFAELVNASDELVEEVISKTADEDTKSPTVKEVRQEVKKEKAEKVSAEDFEADVAGTTSTSPEKPQEPETPKPAESAEDKVNGILRSDFVGRVKKIGKSKIKTMDVDTAHLLLGLNPNYDGDSPMCRHAFDIVCNNVTGDGVVEEELHFDIIDEAVAIITEACY